MDSNQIKFLQKKNKKKPHFIGLTSMQAINLVKKSKFPRKFNITHTAAQESRVSDHQKYKREGILVS